MGLMSDFFAFFNGSFNSSLAWDVLLLVVVLALVSLFIYQFYKSTSKKNLLGLNLRQYNKRSHSLPNKLAEFFLYLLEYIILLPFLIGLWYAALSLVLFLIAEEGTSVDRILLIAAVLIGATRVLAYLKDEVAKDLAKMFPFMALSLFLLTFGDLFSFDRLLDQIRQVPMLLNHVFSFIVVVFAIEIVLRVVYAIYQFWASEGYTDEDKLEKIVREKVREELDNS